MTSADSNDLNELASRVEEARTKLLDERAKLAARLGEIDAMLARLGKPAAKKPKRGELTRAILAIVDAHPSGVPLATIIEKIRSAQPNESGLRINACVMGMIQRGSLCATGKHGSKLYFPKKP